MKLITTALDFIFSNVYLKFLFVMVITLIVAVIAKIVMRKILSPLVRKTKTKVDDLVIKSISSIIFYVVFFLGVKTGLQYFELKTTLWDNLVNSLLVLIVAIFFFRIIHNFSQYWMSEWKSKTRTTADERLIPFLQKILKTVVIILTIFFIFDAWNVNISPLLATAGIAGLAIGLAVKDSLSNILGGLQLVLDSTFKVGDKVQLESGEMGVILDIGLRSTKLKTFDNEVIYIPNGYLANAKIKNFTHPDLSIRVNVEFGVEYGSDSEEVQKVVLKAIKEIGTVVEEPEPAVQFLKMSDFSLDFVARAWVKSYVDAYSTQLVMTNEIYKALNEAGIGIPFPTRTVYTKKID